MYGVPPGGGNPERWHVMVLTRYAGKAMVAARRERQGRYFDPIWSFPGRHVQGPTGKVKVWTLQPSWPVRIISDGKRLHLRRPIWRCHRCQTAPKASFNALYRLAQRALDDGQEVILAR